MAENGEVLDAFVDSSTVIDRNNAIDWARGSGIDEDEGNVIGGEAVEEEVFDAESHNGDAVDLTLEHASGAELHGLGLVVGRADEDFVAARDGNLLELLDQFGEEGVGDFGNDEAEQPASAGDEGTGLGVRKVIELGNGFPHAGG